MTVKQHLTLIRKSGVFNALWIGLGFGCFFGGLSSVLSSGFEIKTLAMALLGTIALYTSIFILVLGLIQIVLTMKIYVGFSLSRMELKKNWNIYISVSGILLLTMSFLYNLVLANFFMDDDMPMRRYLGVARQEMTVAGFLWITVVIALFLFLYLMFFSTVGVIANNYGWQLVLAFVISFISCFLLAFRPLMTFIVWGSGTLPIMAIVILAIVLMYLFCRRGIEKMEVK